MITTIIFDFAGVLTQTPCFPKIAEILSKEYKIEEEKIKNKLYANEGLYIIGKKSTRQFWEESCKDLGISFESFSNAFKTWYKLNDRMIDLTKKLKKEYFLYLLSDNFEIISKELRKNEILKSLFDQMFFSNETSLLKTQSKSFKLLLNTIEKSPEECLFIDDKEKNLVEPSKLGLKTIKFDSFSAFKKELKYLNILTN